MTEFLLFGHFNCAQGPTVSPVFCKSSESVVADSYAIVICVPKKALYESVQQLREVGSEKLLLDASALFPPFS